MACAALLGCCFPLRPHLGYRVVEDDGVGRGRDSDNGVPCGRGGPRGCADTSVEEKKGKLHKIQRKMWLLKASRPLVGFR